MSAVEPEIQYVRTHDGFNIAYYAAGQGPAVVLASLPNSHIQLELTMPDVRRVTEMASQIVTYVRYDHRGFGLSDRNATDFSIDALLPDLEAVVERLSIPSISLIGFGFASPVAVAYAARHPDRVSRLVLWPGWVRVPQSVIDRVEPLVALGAADWEFATESLVRYSQGWNDEMSGPAAAVFRDAVTPETCAAFVQAAKRWDVTDLLRDIDAPVLLVHEQRDPYEMPKSVAAALPHARMVILDGATRPERMMKASAATISFVLGQDAPAAAAEAAPRPEGTTAILFADIVSSTALTEEIGDLAFRVRARELDQRLRAAIREAGGTPVEGKLLGDGVMGVFSFARQAIDAALRCEPAAKGTGLQLHVGVHAGDVIRDEDNVFGGAVNMAARIADASRPGQVLVSDVVRALARTSAAVAFDDCGEYRLKGIAEPQRLYAVLSR